jgi:hypothetical protein
MFAKHGNLKPAARLTAAATLLTWLSALAFCSDECFNAASACGPGASCQPVAAEHHQTEASHNDHDADSQDTDSNHHTPACPEPCKDSLCDSLKSIAQHSAQVSLIKPSFPLAYVLASFCSPDVGAHTQIPSQLREAPERTWVFTPAVCLGPAFRSLAPPPLLVA